MTLIVYLLYIMNLKLRKIRQTNVWNTTIFNCNNRVLSKNLLLKFLDQFWSQIESNFSYNNHLFILLKIKYINNEFATIGNLQRLNFGNKVWYLNVILELMEFKSDYYKETQIESLIFSYGFKDGIVQNKDIFKNNFDSQNYKNKNLPILMNPIDYGRIMIQNKLEKGINYIIQNENGLTINFNKFENYNDVEFLKKWGLISQIYR